jgi:fatty acid desaturase
MQLIFDVDPNWFVLFFAFSGAWALLMFSRKRNGKLNNVKEQIYLAAAGLFSMILMELFATQTNLWNYVPGNWPVILWPTYVAAILFGYQLLRFIEERVTTKRLGMC